MPWVRPIVGVPGVSASRIIVENSLQCAERLFIWRAKIRWFQSKQTGTGYDSGFIVDFAPIGIPGAISQLCYMLVP